MFQRSFHALAVIALAVIALCMCSSREAIADEDAATMIRGEYNDWVHAYKQKNLPRTMEIFASETISTFAGARDSDLNQPRAHAQRRCAGEDRRADHAVASADDQHAPEQALMAFGRS